MSHMARWVRYPHPKSQGSIVRAIELYNKNIYMLQIGQLCSITNYDKRCNKLGQLHYYTLGQGLPQIGAAITN